MAVLAVLTALLALSLLRPANGQRTDAPAVVVRLALDGPIGPAAADYVARGLTDAERRGARVVVLRIDTPGGLDTSMREIVQAILASPVPVAAWVAPQGARAASAGTFILLACHVAAMAPGTAVGAATPVALGVGGAGRDRGGPSASESKAVNDAAAYARGLATLRGRDAAWAERAVREAASADVDEALRRGIVEHRAATLAQLLENLDGTRVTVAGTPRMLRTAGAAVVAVDPDWREHVLAAVTQPEIALLLLTAGIAGLYFELATPGAVAPGVIGAICLLLALYGLHLLPVRGAGAGLLALGLALMVAEAVAPTFGVLGIGGVVAFVAGATMLLEPEVPGFGVPPAVIAVIAAGGATAIGLTGLLVARSRRRQPVWGEESLVGATGVLVREGPGEPRVRVQGELWQLAGELAEPAEPGRRVRVLRREGLRLVVEPLAGDASDEASRETRA